MKEANPFQGKRGQYAWEVYRKGLALGMNMAPPGKDFCKLKRIEKRIEITPWPYKGRVTSKNQLIQEDRIPMGTSPAVHRRLQEGNTLSRLIME